MTVVITGAQGSGKTTLAAHVVRLLQERGIAVVGILQPVVWEAGVRVGYDVEEVHTGRRLVLCRRGGTGEAGDERAPRPTTGPYVFAPETFAAVSATMARVRRGRDVVVIADEIGPLELAGQGWASMLDALAASHPGPRLLVVREALVEAVRRRWASPPVRVCRAGVDRAAAVVSALLGETRTSDESGSPGVG